MKTKKIPIENRFQEIKRKNFKMQDGIAQDLKTIKTTVLDNQKKIQEILDVVELNF